MNRVLATAVLALGFIGKSPAHQFTPANIDAIINYFNKSRVEWIRLAKENADEAIWNQLLNLTVEDVLNDQQIMNAIEKILTFETTKYSDENPLEMIQFTADALRPIVETSKSSEEEQLRCTIVFFILEALIEN